MAGLLLLADEPGKGPDYGKASPVGLLIVVLLLIGVFALVISMNRQLRKVPASFGEPEASETPDVPDSDTTETAAAAETPAEPDPST